MQWLLIESKIKNDKLEASGRCAMKQLFLKFRSLPKIWLQQSLFIFTNQVVKGLHYNSFWIIIFDLQRSYFREYFPSCFSTEVVTQRCSVKKMLLRILQNFEENTYIRVSFLIKLNVSACNFIKKEILTQVFSCKFCEIFKNTFSIEHLRWLLLFLHHIEVIVN